MKNRIKTSYLQVTLQFCPSSSPRPRHPGILHMFSILLLDRQFLNLNPPGGCRLGLVYLNLGFVVELEVVSVRLKLKSNIQKYK